MADIFLSYSNKDRARVAKFYDALIAHGFDVFWDQTVPAGTDWDTWIRRHLTQSRCVIVFWSHSSVASDNVRHEAQIAKEQEKIIPMFLDALQASRLPMGMYTTQGVELMTWAGSPGANEWKAFVSALEDRLTSKWMQVKLDCTLHELHMMRAEHIALRDALAELTSVVERMTHDFGQAIDAKSAALRRVNGVEADLARARADLIRSDDHRRMLEKALAERLMNVATDVQR